MRVPVNSGHTGGKELSWNELEAKIKQKIPEKDKRQTLSDGTKGEYERIFEWSWVDFEKSVSICGPTKMVFTFADWFDFANKGIKDFRLLSPFTITHIKKMENISENILRRKINVSIVKTGSEEKDLILMPSFVG